MKYSPVGELGTIARQYAQSLAQTLSCTVCITDTDQIVAAAGNGKGDLQNQYIGLQMEQVMQERKTVFTQAGSSEYVSVTGTADSFREQIIYPIICQGDVIGTVIFLGKDEKRPFGEVEQKMALAAAGFLGSQMES